MDCEISGNTLEPGDMHCSECSAFVQNDYSDEEMMVLDECP
ncbi:MAG: hypothetical protein VYD77_00230 [Actinomycetota bacterium]|nr:hypothetical protein [Actinomycetota bacterium]